MTDTRTHIENLIKKTEEDLVNCTVQAWIYTKEAVDPKHISKAQAESHLAEYQKRIKSLEQHIELYQLYLKEHGL